MEKRLEDKVERMTASMIIEVLTEYEIVLVDGDMFGKGRKENTFGICDFDKRRIYIDTNHSQTSIKKNSLSRIIPCLPLHAQTRRLRKQH
jgi:hypothetical protein